MSKLGEARASTIPKEVMRVLDWLMSHSIEHRNNELFASSSDLELLSLIREVGLLLSLRALIHGDIVLGYRRSVSI